MDSSTAKAFISAGKAIFTIENPDGKYFTFKVTRMTDAADKLLDKAFVSLLTGPENTKNYNYMGLLDMKTGAVTATRNSKISPDALSFKVAVWFGFVGTAETLDAQKLYGSFNLSPDDVQSIIVVQSGKLILDEETEGRNLVSERPQVLAVFHIGKHYSSHTATLDGAIEIIKSWIDDLDDQNDIMRIFGLVTGAENIRAIGDQRIGWDLP